MKLSIIITNYEQAANIIEMLTPALCASAHTSDFEVIVVDDCSSGWNWNKLKSDLETQLPDRLRVIVCPKHCGRVGEVRNYGLIFASGEYVWFVDGDDRIAHDAIVRVLSAIDHHPECNCFVLDYESRECSSAGGEPTAVNFSAIHPRLQLHEVGCMCWFKVIRRSSLVEFRPDSSEDVDWWLRQSAALNNKYRTVPGGVCYYYFHRSPISFTGDLEKALECRSVESLTRYLFANVQNRGVFAAYLRMISAIIEFDAPNRELGEYQEFLAHAHLRKLADALKQ